MMSPCGSATRRSTRRSTGAWWYHLSAQLLRTPALTGTDAAAPAGGRLRAMKPIGQRPAHVETQQHTGAEKYQCIVDRLSAGRVGSW